MPANNDNATRKSAIGLFRRHYDDPRFSAIVDMLVAYMMAEKIAPDEIRDAAFVASIKFMQMQPVRDLIYVRDDFPGAGG